MNDFHRTFCRQILPPVAVNISGWTDRPRKNRRHIQQRRTKSPLFLLQIHSFTADTPTTGRKHARHAQEARDTPKGSRNPVTLVTRTGDTPVISTTAPYSVYYTQEKAATRVLSSHNTRVHWHHRPARAAHDCRNYQHRVQATATLPRQDTAPHLLGRQPTKSSLQVGDKLDTPHPILVHQKSHQKSSSHQASLSHPTEATQIFRDKRCQTREGRGGWGDGDTGGEGGYLAGSRDCTGPRERARSLG